MSWSAATPDHGDVERYVARITDEIRAVFGDRVVGVWLLGSLAYGGFGPTSDVDLQAAVHDPTPVEIALLVERIRHPVLRCPAAGLEFVLYDAAVLTRPTVPLLWSLNLNGGPRREAEVSTDPASESWHWFLLDLAIGRETARTLAGRDIADVVGAISREDQVAAIAESVQWHADHDCGTPNQAANAARGLRFLRTGRWGSKPEAVQWMRSQGHTAEEVIAELSGLMTGGHDGAAAVR